MAQGAPRRAGRRLLVALAIGYVPIALTATLDDFLPSVPRLQLLLDRTVGGEEYATGTGSVRALRAVDYLDHRVLMLVHTVLGAVCLALAVRQLVGPARRHRIAGRVHVLLVTVSMAAAVLFLLASEPGPGSGQAAFRAQLWVLAASTLGTAWLAALEARRGNFGSHRAWMVVHVAFLMTAPTLRLAWTVVVPLLPGRTMLANIESGAVLLAVAAPAAGVLVALRPALAEHGLSPGPGSRRRGWVGPTLLVSSGVAAVLIVAAAVAPSAGLVWFHVVPVVAVAAWCAVALEPAGDGAVVWWCAASTPWAVLALALPATVASDPWTALVTGLMVAPGFPLVAAMSFVLARHAARERASFDEVPDRLPSGAV